MYHNVCIHSSVNGYLGCFHVLAIAKSAGMNVGVYASLSVMVFSGICPAVRLLGHQFSSVAQLCLTLCETMNHSMPGLPVHHQLLEFTQTHVHPAGDAIQPSHPLYSRCFAAETPALHHLALQWTSLPLPNPQSDWFLSLYLEGKITSSCAALTDHVYLSHMSFKNKVA